MSDVDRELASVIDHTLLRPEADADEVDRLCAEAKSQCARHFRKKVKLVRAWNVLRNDGCGRRARWRERAPPRR